MIAPAVPYMLVKINGSMPKAGVAAVGSHFLPNRKLISPICRMAGIPETMRYIDIRSTHATVTSPSIKKMP